MSLASYLPVLEGWELDIWSLPAPRTIVKNRVDLVKRFDKPGWLGSISFVVDDCFANPYVHYPTIPPQSLMPYLYHEIVGATQPQMQGPFVQKYYRPVPTSTAGLYDVEFEPSYPNPYVEWAEILAELDPSSTQSSATILLMSVGRTVITDENEFRRSLDKVLGTDKITEAIERAK